MDCAEVETAIGIGRADLDHRDIDRQFRLEEMRDVREEDRREVRPTLVDRRADVAAASGAHGVQLPEDGLPVGIQFLAPAREDARLYQVGAALEKMHEEVWGKRMIDFAPELEVK